jgi:hypothetical protein
MNKKYNISDIKGVTIEELDIMDLGFEIKSMSGYQFRMRKVTFEPGGVFGPVHNHKDRTDHRNGVTKDYGPGLGWPEDKNTIHWLENRGIIPAIEISVDIIKQES